MLRYLYSALFYLLTPVLLLRLRWRARLAPAYGQRWSERFGLVPARAQTGPAIWIHAVSVGETLAALPLIHQLLQRYPNHCLIVTTMTPTGSERVCSALHSWLGERVVHTYMPYDIPLCINLFLRRMRPDLVIIMETELWPNCLHACARRGIPVVLANARLSARSARGYRRFAGLTRPMLQQLTLIAAQHQDDAARFLELGVASARCVVTGSIKFDISLSTKLREQAAALRNDWGAGQRPILLAASTHQGEDELVLDAFSALLASYPDLLLVLVPRHPERFAPVESLCRRQFQVQTRRAGGAVAATTQVLVGDTMGEMMPFFGACDIAFMGGSWVDKGGHNMIEPAAWGKPVLTGPSLFNFAEVSRLLLVAGAMRVVATPEALTQQVSDLLQHPETAGHMGAAAQQVAEANRGALNRLLLLLAPWLETSGS